jgi:hypothetical protein
LLLTVLGAEVLLVLLFDILWDHNTELQKYRSVKAATFTHLLEGLHDQLFLAIGFPTDLRPGREQPLLLCLQGLSLRVVVLDLI